LESFEYAAAQNQLDNAFIYGMRYCTFCVESIPKHDYYSSSKFQALKSKTSRQVADVLTKLEHVADLMDMEEIEKERVRKEKEEAERLERERRREAERDKQLAELEARINSFKTADMQSSTATANSSKPDPNQSLEHSAFAKLQMLSGGNKGPAPAPTAPNSHGGIDPPTTDLSQLQPVPPPTVEDASSDEEDDYDDDDGQGGSGAPPPPSYNQASALRQSSYFGPGRDGDDDNSKPKKSVSFSATNQVKLIPPNNKHSRDNGPPSYNDATDSSSNNATKKIKRKKKRKLNIKQVVQIANREYAEHIQSGKIQISKLGTYQGRVRGSTNGCTVISALCASRHLETQTGLTTSLANQVIDQMCVPLLRKIRTKLQLGDGSLIIPSDVHDHLVDAKLLFQHKFVGAAGGNILDPEHLGPVLEYLHFGCDNPKEAAKTGSGHRKAAATLFFKEHVISIVKFPTSTTEAVYDLIDSLPKGGTGVGSRTRCHGIDALRVLLQWYACSKFSPSNIQYLSSHPWEESMADFDPRVFQAFVWSDRPMPKQ